MVKRLVSILLLLASIFLLASCGGEIYGHAELEISLPEKFREFEADSFDAAYTNGKALVGIIRISFDASFNEGVPDFLTPEQFARFYKTATKREGDIAFHRDTPYYEYSEVQSGVKNLYLASFYRSKYAYFAVIFATPEIFSESLREEFLAYTETVIFNYDK